MIRTMDLEVTEMGGAAMVRVRVETPVIGDSLAKEDVSSEVLVRVSGVGTPSHEDSGRKVSVAGLLGLLHVLVVDDDEAVRKACCKIASGMGFAVVLSAESAT